MILQRWDCEEHNYRDYKIPDEWNVKTYLPNMKEKINCAQCGKKLEFGDCYTSLEIHTNMGLGYGVCEECYQKEWYRKERYNAKN